MRQHRSPVLLVLGCLLALMVSACADDATPASSDGQVDDATSSAATPASTAPAATMARSPSPGTVSTPPVAPTPVLESDPPAPGTPTASGAPATPGIELAARLLPAGKVGKLNQEWRWLAGNDLRREPARMVACHRAGLLDIGADELAVREYTSDLDAAVRAYQLVAAYPDEMTARRAHRVLESWHGSCKQRLEQRSSGGDGVHVSPIEQAPTSRGTGLSYVSFRPTATGTAAIDNVGFLRDGRVLTLVVVKLEGDDYNYPRGRTPAATTLRAAAALVR
jgi:hypothetical protein